MATVTRAAEADRGRLWFAQVWGRLTEPVGDIRQAEQRRRARLLSALLVVLIPVAVIGIAATSFAPGYNPLADPFFYVALVTIVGFCVAYGLSRTKHYMAGAALLVGMLSPLTLGSVVAFPKGLDTLIVYLSLDMLLASMLLTIRGTLILAGANFVGISVLPFLNRELTIGRVAPDAVFFVLMAALIVVAAMIRQADLTQIERQSSELAKAVEEAREANRLKSQFLATMSHELRTPLNAIIGFTEVMMMGLTGQLPTQAQHTTQRIHHNSERLLGLIDDILDISKIEAGRLEVVHQPFEPTALLASIQTSLGPQARKKELNLVTKLDEKLPTRLVGDFQRIEQVVLNLGSNAVKFTDKGSIDIALKQIDENEWGIVVTDTGIGIPPHARDIIFEKFRQVDGSSRRAYGGSGLGLAITKELVLLMDGTIKVESELGTGSTFTVALPMKLKSGKEN